MEGGKPNPSYRRPDKRLKLASPMVAPLPHLSLERPPPSRSPEMPQRPSGPPIPGFQCTRHVIPAAYPREYPGSTGSLDRSSSPFTSVGAANETREEKSQRIDEDGRRVLRDRLQAPRYAQDASGQAIKNQTLPSSPPLWLGAERWIRLDQKGAGNGVTLVVLHANGFHKETFRPTLEHIIALGPIAPGASFGGQLARSNRNGPDVRIDEVWLLDDLHHGTSVDLNAGLLGTVHSWPDGGRDVNSFIRNYLPSIDVLEVDAVLTWKEHVPGRRVFGVGHSLGGTALCHAAHADPDLYHGICLIDPTILPIVRTLDDIAVQKPFLVTAAMKRRNDWADRDEAIKSLRSSPFFAKFDSAVLEHYYRYALMPSPSEESKDRVALATPPWCETAVFGETEGLGRAWDRLGEVRCPVGFIMAGDNTATLGDAVTAEMVWKPESSRNERIMNSGHLIVQERPRELADAIWRYISSVSLTMSAREQSPRARL